MNYQPLVRLGISVDPIPEPRTVVRRLMLAISLVVDGPLEAKPERFDPRLANCLYMPQASLLIAGTGCGQPLLLREAVDMSAAAELDVLIVRTGDHPDQVSFDFKATGADRPLCAYRLWMPRPSEAAWLIPAAGEQRFVRLTSLGLELRNQAPFADPDERRIGLVRGDEFLSVAVKGWF
ncbi:MAG TPA: hypothetical protein VF628_10300 [Allosphingosinicella sp.]|jgi:hypothetical protein